MVFLTEMYATLFLNLFFLRVLWNEVLSVTNDFFYPSISKMYEKEPRYNET